MSQELNKIMQQKSNSLVEKILEKTLINTDVKDDNDNEKRDKQRPMQNR